MLEKNLGFSDELTKLLPALMMEFSKKRMTEFTSGEISLPFVTIIEFIYAKDICKMGELAEVLNLSMGAVTCIVDKMIEMDFVSRERSTHDRRVVLVTLTKKGIKTAKKIEEERKKFIDEIFMVLTDREKDTYLKLLTKVVKGMRGKDGEN